MARAFLADGPGDIHPIPGLKFGYGRDGRVDLWKTTLGSLRFQYTGYLRSIGHIGHATCRVEH